MNEGQGGLASGGIYSTPVQQSGDIVIDNSKPKKSWKKWAIWGAAVIVVIGVAVMSVSMFLLPSNDYKKEFNRFANFVIRGADSEDEIFGTYDESAPYVISIAATRYSDDDRIAYFERMHDLWEGIANSELKNVEYFDSLSGDVDFLCAYSKMGVPTVDELKEVFYENGDAPLLNGVLAKYGEFDMTSSVVGEYISLLESYASIMSDVFEADDGFLEGGLMAEKLYNNIIDYVYNIADSVAKECFYINIVISGETNA